MAGVRILPILFNTDMVWAILDGRKTVTRRVVRNAPNRDDLKPYKAPGVIGLIASNGKVFTLKPPYQSGDILYVRETWSITDNLWNGMDMIIYRAAYNGSKNSNIKWRPSIHMPREAARIFLRVTDVRVERLQDVTDEDVVAEGLEIGDPFDELWDSTIKPSDRNKYGWDANPWVWVIEFECYEKPDDGGH